ncbi:MAG: BrnT family toxin [Rhodospirillales bacterium]
MYEWDEAKRKANLRKHGVDFALIWRFEWPNAVIERDGRRDYGEERFCATGIAQGEIYRVAFTYRGAATRAISMRRANKREAKDYEQES